MTMISFGVDCIFNASSPCLVVHDAPTPSLSASASCLSTALTKPFSPTLQISLLFFTSPHLTSSPFFSSFPYPFLLFSRLALAPGFFLISTSPCHHRYSLMMDHILSCTALPCLVMTVALMFDFSYSIILLSILFLPITLLFFVTGVWWQGRDKSSWYGTGWLDEKVSNFSLLISSHLFSSSPVISSLLFSSYLSLLHTPCLSRTDWLIN